MPNTIFSCGRILLVALCATIACGDEFPEPYDSEPLSAKTLMPPSQAAAEMGLPEGFRAQLFAAEPDVRNPIGMAWDARGRLWIAENYTYAERPLGFEAKLRDRVLIFEDTNGDGKADSRTVFADNLQRLTSVEVGHDGVWLMCPPRVLFIPDRNADDRPDGPPQVVLDGFEVGKNNSHNFANGLRFGPDGWLYGRCGHSCPGLIGRPSTPPSQRYPIRGGLWRYHPGTKHVEVLTSGTVNPWGHDWNEQGEPFFVNTVTGHLWHLLPGAHYARRGTDPYRGVYEVIDQHADHYHFDTGQSWTASRDGKANSLGGGHAHSGAMIYLGDNWPESYRGNLFTLNFHGRRMNQEKLVRVGGGYVGKHAADLALSTDRWFRGIDLSYGPDGGVFVLDWSDTGECHESTGVHRNSGRIFKIAHADNEQDAKQRSKIADLKTLSEKELLRLQTHANAWYPRRARVVLASRALNGKISQGFSQQLRERYEKSSDPTTQLRYLLTMQACGLIDRGFVLQQTQHSDEYIRATAIRMLTAAWPIDGPLGPVDQTEKTRARVETEAKSLQAALVALAREDDSALVRRVLASTLQRLPIGSRVELAIELVTHAEDADDHNLPLLVWYGLIPVANAQPASLVAVARNSAWPTTRRLIARRLSEELPKNSGPLNQLLELALEEDAADAQCDFVQGIRQGMQGWRTAKPPANWQPFREAVAEHDDRNTRLGLRQIGLTFGDQGVVKEVKQIAGDATAAVEDRRLALQSLITHRPDDLRALCEVLLSDTAVRVVAAQGLATFKDDRVAQTLLARYPVFAAGERPAVISLLVSRPNFAAALFDSIAAGKIARKELSAYHIRQLRSLKQPQLTKRATELWGTLNETPRDKLKQIASWKQRLTDEKLSASNLAAGRALFTKNCAQCHRLYGEGGQIGPDLTGSNRDNLDYLLENIVHPSAVVNKDYRMSVVETADGRVLNGLITRQTDRTLHLQTPTEEHVLERAEIETVEQTTLSPMPEGLLSQLKPEQVRDLIGFLMRSGRGKSSQ